MEPLPPGLEAQIQCVLDAYKAQPLVGCEYVVEREEEAGVEPNYNCLLCGKDGDPRTIIIHLISVDHRMTFLVSFYFVISSN